MTGPARKEKNIGLAVAASAMAAVQLVAGIYLLNPAVHDFGYHLQPQQTEFVGVFLLLTAVSIVFSIARPNVLASSSTMANLFVSGLIGPLGLLAYAGVEIAIGTKALFASPPNLWAATLLLPGLVGLAFAITGYSDEAVEEDDEGEDAIEPESGQVDVTGTAPWLLVYGFYYAVYLFAVMVWFALAFWLFYRLQEIVLQGMTFDAAAAWASIGETLIRIVTVAAPMSVVLALLFIGISIVSMLLRSLAYWGKRDANRDLSSAEIAYIETSAVAVRDYAIAQGYARNVWLMQMLGLFSVFAGIGAGGAATFAAIHLLETTSPDPSFPIELRPGGLSSVLWIFVGIMVSPLTNRIASLLSVRYAERAGWIAIGEKNEYFTLKGKLTTFVRSGRLSASTAIDPGEFLRAANGSLEVYFLGSAAILAVIATFFMTLDARTVSRLSADGIDLMSYWTQQHHHYTYSDVKQVEIRCVLSDKGKPGEAYELHFGDGRSLDIHKTEDLITSKLAAYEAIDAKLVAQGTPFVPSTIRPWFREPERGYDMDCVDKFVADFPNAIQPRIRRLLHADELKAVDTIWPWDAKLARAKQAADRYDVANAVALYSKEIASGRLKGHLLSVAYAGRGDARNDYNSTHGYNDADMVLALADYRKARALEPTVHTFRLEGDALVALGAYPDATQAYRGMLRLDEPKPYWSLIHLASVERILGRYDAALAYLDRAIREWGTEEADMPVYYDKARVLFLKQDNAGVVDVVTKGLAYEKDSFGALRFRACAEARLGNFAKAKADIADAIRFAHRPSSNAAWEHTPLASAFYQEFDRDRTTIDAMAADTSTQEQRATLCGDIWHYAETLRPRSPLLPLH